MRHARELLQPLCDRVVADAGRTGGRSRRGRVLTVVSAAQARLRRQWVVGSELDPVEPHPARHDPDARSLEDAQLRVAVGLERAVAVEVIGLEVEQHGDVARERLDVFELERRELADDPVRSADRRKRRADVPGDRDVERRRPEDRAEQLGRRRLAVRACDADELRVVRQQAPGHLDLGLDGDRDERALTGHARALDEHVDPFEEVELELVAERPVDEDDVVAALVEAAGDRLAGTREPVDERLHRG